MTYSLTIVTDPKAFDASFYGARAPESFFTEHYATHDKFIKAVKILAARFPEARLQANVRIPEGLIEEARNLAPASEPVEPSTGPALTFEELFGPDYFENRLNQFDFFTEAKSEGFTDAQILDSLEDGEVLDGISEDDAEEMHHCLTQLIKLNK